MTVPEGKYADIGGGLQIHYHEAGRGTPLLWLHGSGPGASGWSNFRRNFPFFAERGYRFATADEVLADPAFAEEHRFLGPRGPGLWERLLDARRRAAAETAIRTLLAERTVYLARAVQGIDPFKLLLAQAAIGSALFLLGSALLEPAPTRWTGRLAASLAFQGVVVAGFNFVVNLWLLKRYRPSSLAAFFLTQPLFGVALAALVAGDALTIELLVASLAVAAGIGLTSR